MKYFNLYSMKRTDILLNSSNWLIKENAIQCLVKVKPYTQKELCQLYETSDKTFLKWLAPFRQQLGSKTGRYYSVLQVEIIFLKLGIPYIIRDDA